MIKFFTASWCTSCNNLKNSLQEGDLANVQIIDADNEPEAIKSANVRSIPTFIKYDEEGNEVNRLLGTVSRSRLLSWMNE